jgi:rfaE bifunctional protein kinase chain/domain
VDRLTIEKFKNTRVLVLGDVMIDAYLFGKVERISPEAPVPVVAVVHKENRLGGAANVAVNLVALGAKPILCSVVGNDAEGKDLIDLIKSSGIGADGIIQSKERVTTIKTRVISQSTQMLRIDNEITDSLNQEDDQKLISKVRELLKNADVIIFEDYDKGVISEHLISQITDEANALNIPIVVDPKKRNFMSYQKASLFKPNLKELREGFKRDFDIDNKEEFESVCKDLMQDMGLKNLFVTLSERGVMITNGNEFYYIPAHLRKIADVSGAGDTVISVASLCMALGLPLKQVAQISNLAGGLVCEEVGVVPINKEKLIEEIESIDW